MRNLACALLLLSSGCDTSRVATASFAQLDLRRCKPRDGTTGSPSSIEEAIALANALPKPTSAACFVEALDRPLHLEASKSASSAQPAVGARSPRLFVFSGAALVITIATDGNGRDLIEFGEMVSERRSVKAELEFPLAAKVASDLAYTRIRNPEHDNITTCFVCHDAEHDEPEYPGGRSSLALRPRESSLLPVSSLQTEFDQCDSNAEPKRCAMLTALVSWGPLEHQPFDVVLPLF